MRQAGQEQMRLGKGLSESVTGRRALSLCTLTWSVEMSFSVSALQPEPREPWGSLASPSAALISC